MARTKRPRSGLPSQAQTHKAQEFSHVSRFEPPPPIHSEGISHSAVVIAIR